MPSENNLLPFAASMSTLLHALKDIPFYGGTDQESVSIAGGEERTQSERAPSLATLMQILVDQADHDGFRLITINTEAKRVIMACNRQGRPPAPVITIPAATGEESSEEESKKKSGRAGTSVRCQCRMRVNINFHSKLNAWRITSYEDVHNHDYRVHSAEGTKPEPMSATEPYVVSERDVQDAIDKYMSKRRVRRSEGDVALLLSSLSSMPSGYQDFSGFRRVSNASVFPRRDSSTSLASGSSPSGPTSAKSEASPFDHERAPESPPVAASRSPVGQKSPPQGTANPIEPQVVVTIDPSPPLSENQIPSPQEPASIFEHKVQVESPRFCLPSISDIKNMPRRYGAMTATPNNSYTNVSSQGQLGQIMDSQASGTLKNLASTAIEIDRYAMLHSAFKKVIALACKKREWTEDVLSNVGRMTENLKAMGAPIFSTPSDIGGSRQIDPFKRHEIDEAVRKRIKIENSSPTIIKLPGMAPNIIKLPTTSK